MIASLASGSGGRFGEDAYVSIENLTGRYFADRLTGDGGDDVRRGGAGADTLDGGGGVNTASSAGSTVGVAANLVTGMGIFGDAEGDTYKYIQNLVGGAGNDTLIGDVNNNVLEGDAGADTLSLRCSARATLECGKSHFLDHKRKRSIGRRCSASFRAPYDPRES